MKQGSKNETVPRVSINETSTTKVPSGSESKDSGQNWKIVHHNPRPTLEDADTIYVGNNSSQKSK